MLRLDEDSAGRNDGRDGLQACSAHRLARLNKVDNAIRDAERTCRLDTATDILDVCLQLRVLGDLAVGLAALLSLQLAEVLLGQVCERGDYVLADQVLGLGQVALLRDLDLQAALAKVEVKDLDDARCRGGGDAAFVLFDLVAAGDSEVNAAFADEGGDVGGRQEDEREGKVLDERNVEARVAVELDVGAVEEVEADLVEAALCSLASEMEGAGKARPLGDLDLLLGTAKSNRSLRLLPSVSVMNGKLRLPLRALCMMNSSSFAPLATPLGAPLVRDMVQTMYGEQKKTAGLGPVLTS